MKAVSFISVFFVLAATSAMAETNIYKCTILKSDSTWIPETLQLSHDVETGEIMVIDPIIHHFNDKKPLSAAVSVDNAKRTSYAWTLKGVKNSSGQYAPSFVFRATIMKAYGRLRMTSQPQRYVDTFTGSGRCIKSVGYGDSLKF